MPPLAQLNPDPARVVVNFHTGFNLALAATFILLTGPMARLLARMLPDRPVELDPSRPRHLDRTTLDTPSLALAHAAREALRMGDLIETMLRDSFEVLRRGDPEKLRGVAAMDDRVDKLHEAIKLFVTDVSREPLSAPREPPRGGDPVVHDQSRAHRRHRRQEPARAGGEEDPPSAALLARGL